MLSELNQCLSKWEPTWLFIVLHVEALSGWVGVFYLAKRLAVLTEKRTYTKKKKEDFECLTQGEAK